MSLRVIYLLIYEIKIKRLILIFDDTLVLNKLNKNKIILRLYFYIMSN